MRELTANKFIDALCGETVKDKQNNDLTLYDAETQTILV